MSDKPHPILEELATQLPESSKLFLHIQEGKDYAEIATLAKNDISCLENVDGVLKDGQSAKSVLHQNGYQRWLEISEEDDRLRVFGALSLIAELSEELAED
jgi:hypothetical protein